jgi:hypothetical protein
MMPLLTLCVCTYGRTQIPKERDSIFFGGPPCSFDAGWMGNAIELSIVFDFYAD